MSFTTEFSSAEFNFSKWRTKDVWFFVKFWRNLTYRTAFQLTPCYDGRWASAHIHNLACGGDPHPGGACVCVCAVCMLRTATTKQATNQTKCHHHQYRNVAVCVPSVEAFIAWAKSSVALTFEKSQNRSRAHTGPDAISLFYIFVSTFRWISHSHARCRSSKVNIYIFRRWTITSIWRCFEWNALDAGLAAVGQLHHHLFLNWMIFTCHLCGRVLFVKHIPLSMHWRDMMRKFWLGKKAAN